MMRARQPKFALMLAVVALFLGLTACRQQAPHHSDASAESFAGCYELKLGRWWPWGFGGDNEYVSPPTRIHLLAELGTKGFEQDGFLIRAMNGAAPGRGSPSYWQVRSDEKIDLIWNDGFTGVGLELERRGDELRGWAHPHFDASPLIPRTARVTAQRIACDGFNSR